MKVVFLDFDGVLNSWEFWEREIASDPSLMGGIVDIDTEAVARLNRLIKETGAVVVISSTWRRIPPTNTIAGAQDYLVSKGFGGLVLDLTPCFGGRPRGEEIEAWLDTQDLLTPVTSFVILDDDSDMIPFMDYLIKTSMEDGLQDHHVDAAIAILNQIELADVAVLS